MLGENGQTASVFANPENRAQQQNREHTERDCSVLPVFFLQEQNTGDGNAHHWRCQHQQHSRPFNICWNMAMDEESDQQASEHNEETTEGAHAQDPSNHTVECWFADLAHAAPPLNKCTSR